MKKFLISVLTAIMFISQAQAGEPVSYCCSVPEKLSNPICRGVTNAMGCNLAAKKTAKIIVKKLLKKNADGDFDVKIDSFSAMDLKRGKFKSVEITGENITYNGSYVSSVKLKTLCDYNYVEYNKKPLVFHTDVPLSFNAVITEEDLNRTLIDIGYIKKLCDMNIAGITLFTVDNVEFKLKNNKIYMITCLKAPFLMGERSIRISFSGKLNIENGRIVIDNLASENLRNIDFSKFLDRINDSNPFNMPVKVFKDCDSTLNISNVKIVDNKICIDGIIVIKRSCDGQTKEKK